MLTLDLEHLGMECERIRWIVFDGTYSVGIVYVHSSEIVFQFVVWAVGWWFWTRKKKITIRYSGNFNGRSREKDVNSDKHNTQTMIYDMHRYYLPFMDDSLDKTLDDELLSRCASFNSRRYSSPDDMNGIGVTRSELWKDIGDAQLVMSTQDSANKNQHYLAPRAYVVLFCTMKSICFACSKLVFFFFFFWRSYL